MNYPHYYPLLPPPPPVLQRADLQKKKSSKNSNNSQQPPLSTFYFMDPQYQYFNQFQNSYNQNNTYYGYHAQQPYYYPAYNTVSHNTQEDLDEDEVDEVAEEDEGTWVLTDEAIALFAAGEERRKQRKKQQEEDEKKQRADEIFAELEARNQGRELIAQNQRESAEENID